MVEFARPAHEDDQSLGSPRQGTRSNVALLGRSAVQNARTRTLPAMVDSSVGPAALLVATFKFNENAIEHPGLMLICFAC